MTEPIKPPPVQTPTREMGDRGKVFRLFRNPIVLKC